jgi:trimeric autotransporter adhesin
MKSVTPTNPDQNPPINRTQIQQLSRQYRSTICSVAIATITLSLPLLFPDPAQAASCIAGTVFEDKNYGGGSGRSLVTATGIGRPGARVELYDSTGAFNSFATTDPNGLYSFDCSAIASGRYTVRVVNNTVTSSRNTAVAGLIPIQTFRTNGGSADTSRVGGERPEWADAAQGSSGTTLAALTNLATSTTPLSIATVTSGTTATGVDFGYNFDTIVNTNDSGQGSLRQFILNSNALTGESSLLQANTQLPAGYETSIFMIPNGVANPGQNNSYTNQLNTSYGAAVINLVTALDPITGSNTRLDGATQTVNVANTNPGTVGSINTVGVDGNSVAKFDRPEVEIKGQFTLTSTGSNNQIKSIAFNAHRILVNGSNSLVQDNLVGMQADGTNNATTAEVEVNSYGIEAGAASDITIRHNYMRVNQSGIRRDNNGTKLTIEQNEVDSPSSGQTLTYDGILLIGAGSNDIVRNNLVKNQRGGGIEVGFYGTTLTNTLIENNTVFHNGYTTYGGTTPSTETMGIVAYALTPNSSVVFSKNIITENSGPGVVVMNAAGIKLTKNSIFKNGASGNGFGLSIDLDANTRDPNSYITAEGVTPNTGTMSSTLPNGGMNYPIFTRVRRVGNTLKLAGYIGNVTAGNSAFAGARIEIYKSDDDGNQNGKVVVGDTLSTPHGEGRDYIGYIVADANGLFNTTNAATPFVVDGISPITLAATDKITATATSSATAAIAPNSTSEFSENTPLITNDPQLVLVKRVTAIGSTAITTTIDDTVTTKAANDNNSKWPLPIDSTSGISTLLKGSLNTSKVLPNQEIEYTIYFLSAGNVPIKTVNICDLIPINTTYVAGSGKISFNGAAATALSGESMPAGAVMNTTVPGIGLCKSTTTNAQTTANLSAAENPNGLVWVQVDKNRSALAENEYGYIRFRVLTNAQ